jgi:hypothetical protein
MIDMVDQMIEEGFTPRPRDFSYSKFPTSADDINISAEKERRWW